MKLRKYILLVLLFFTSVATAQTESLDPRLDDLKNFQVNTAHMISSGLPNQLHFQILKGMGVTKVIDLIPGDRSKEQKLTSTMGFSYHNIQVDWENPTLDNFYDYVASMKQPQGSEGKTLTHCRLNWRGAAFTYLYRVTELKESEDVAKRDMLAIWTPNPVWQKFIDQVKADYQK